ncbi:unnamed protein product [Linum tenue]|uniref:ADP-ribosyl cyclase/cyclic ADP-ribose hydrolase n=3 Tax=Linum TaxID=4005 RepID=A0AAV0QE34_9ROSI|nr:unnamed protein product [Linum tenue]
MRQQNHHKYHESLTGGGGRHHFRKRRRHNVFISFRGSDVRNTFAGHLRAALRREGLRSFSDRRDLPRGEDLKEAIPRAIQRSRVSVVVLSRNYASSEWCLDELVTIMSCCSRAGHVAIPIFYHLSPNDVVSGCYKEDLDRHKRDFTYERVDGWIRALAWVAGIAGWVVPAAGRSEARLVKRIAKTIRQKERKPCSGTERVPPAGVIRKNTNPSIVLYVKEFPDGLHNMLHQFPTSNVSHGRRRHDVFISFRGSDVRHTFVSRLRAALRREGVTSFADHDMPRGQDLTEAIPRAIERSRVSVVVLSRNYASSVWCLDELVTIMRYCNTTDVDSRPCHVAIPIFYHLSPEDVSGCYEEDMDGHKRRFTYERVDGWLRALAWIARIAGWVVPAAAKPILSVPLSSIKAREKTSRRLRRSTSPFSSDSSPSLSLSLLGCRESKGKARMGIRFILMVNKQGQTRLAQYYEWLTLEERRAIEGEIVRKCLARNEQQCSFVEHRNYKIVYRRYASLFFLVGVDNDENELAILEFIHLLVETMDRHFGNVCELDIMFHLEKAHFMLEEMVMNGCIVETSKSNILSPIQLMEKTS